MRAFLAALQFLTVLPVPGRYPAREQDWAQATAYYPLVGLVLGVLLAGADWGLRKIWPGPVASGLVLAAWVALTGALHLDGFVDCCDGLLAAVPPERRLEILRDVHVGAFGVIGVILLLLLKYLALSALPEAIRLPGLILVPVLGRWGMTGAVLLYPYARPGPGLGRKAKSGTGLVQLAIASGSALLISALAWWTGLGWAAALLPIVAALSVAIAGGWIRSRIGGLTGDAYGAICELIEVICLLALSGLFRQGVLP
jgi:adenosylcobinamide-GDP ribazoletransferase